MYRFFGAGGFGWFWQIGRALLPSWECRAPRARVASLGAPARQLEMEPAAMSTTGKRKLADSAESSTAAPTAAPTPAPLSIVTATAGSKGRKQKMEDVTVTVDWLDAPAGASVKDLPARRRAFYAILDGHGGRDCADWVAERLAERDCIMSRRPRESTRRFAREDNGIASQLDGLGVQTKGLTTVF